MKNLFQKIFFICAVIAATSCTTNLFTPQDTSALDRCNVIGFVAWDCNTGLTKDAQPNESAITTGIWVAVANVVTDITVAAAYLVLGYVIYAGYLYTFSGGDPGKVATGKKALYHAFMGLAIVMSASIILNSIRIALGSPNFSADCATTTCVQPQTMIEKAIEWTVGIAGAVSAIFVVYGGISYISSAGDPGKLQKAKNMILYALIGLAVVALSEIIVAFVSGMINNATAYNITKELYA